MKQLFTIIIFLLITIYTFSQCVITNEMALKTALDNGFERGLDSFIISHDSDTTIKIRCLLCDEDESESYNNIRIDCRTGKIDSSVMYLEMSVGMHYGIRRMKTLPYTIDDKTQYISLAEPFLLTNLNDGNEQHVSISNQNKIVFSFGFRKIGVINIDGSGFKLICNECLYPQWSDNDNIVCIKDFEHIYKININTLVQTRLTVEKYYYSDFSISPDGKWLALVKDKPHPEKDSLGRLLFYTHSCTEPNEMDLWILDLTKPGVQRKINKISSDIYNPKWSANSDSLFFNIGDSVLYCTNLGSDNITYSSLTKPFDIALNEYNKLNHGVFPLINNCKIYEMDYFSRRVTRVLINERGRYQECLLSNDLKYLIFTKNEKQYGDTKIWIKKIE